MYHGVQQYSIYRDGTGERLLALLETIAECHIGKLLNGPNHLSSFFSFSQVSSIMAEISWSTVVLGWHWGKMAAACALYKITCSELCWM